MNEGWAKKQETNLLRRDRRPRKNQMYREKPINIHYKAVIDASSVINRKFVIKTKDACIKCGEKPTRMCAMCRDVFYCGLECQQCDWKNHKTNCGGGQYSSQVSNV
jgi:hypothetical protein